MFATLFLGLWKILILRSTLLLGFGFFDTLTYNILRHTDLRVTFRFFFQKCSKDAWEYSSDHTEYHNSGENAPLKKIQFFLFPIQYTYERVNPGTFWIHLSQFAGKRGKSWGPYG